MKKIMIILCIIFLPTFAFGKSNKKNIDEGVATCIKAQKTIGKCLNKLALNNNIQAQGFLGLMYISGQGGITEDYKKALYWCNKASVKGSLEGQVGLATIYANGFGVGKSPTKAYAWVTIATKNGYTNGDKVLKSLAKKMSNSELKQAKALTVKLSKTITD